MTDNTKLYQFKYRGRWYRGEIVKTSASGKSVRMRPLQDQRSIFGTDFSHFRELAKSDRYYVTGWLRKSSIKSVGEIKRNGEKQSRAVSREAG